MSGNFSQAHLHHVTRPFIYQQPQFIYFLFVYKRRHFVSCIIYVLPPLTPHPTKETRKEWDELSLVVWEGFFERASDCLHFHTSCTCAPPRRVSSIRAFLTESDWWGVLQGGWKEKGRRGNPGGWEEKGRRGTQGGGWEGEGKCWNPDLGCADCLVKQW